MLSKQLKKGNVLKYLTHVTEKKNGLWYKS